MRVLTSKPKNRKLIVGRDVEPIKRSAMLLRELGRDPHDRSGVQAGHVRDELVSGLCDWCASIGFLDQDQPILAHFTTEDVGPEGPDSVSVPFSSS